MSGTPGVHIALRSRWPVVGIAVLALLMVLLPSPVWTTMGLVLAGLLLLSYGWVRALAHGLHAERRARFRWVAVGDLLEEWFTLTNDSTLPALWVILRDRSDVPGYRVSSVRSVNARSTLRWREQAVCQRRGRYHIGPWSLYLSDPFGFVEAEISYDDVQEIIIHPPIDAPPLGNLPQGDGRGRARRRQRSWQRSVTAAGARAYHPGDPLNHIHWPLSAHRDQLMTRSFDRDTAGDLWLMLDARADVQLGQELEGSEEQAILYAASFVVQTLGGRRAVGLAAYGTPPQLIPPGRSAGQRWRLLEALATLRMTGSTSLSAALADVRHSVRSGSAVLLITPNDQSDWLPQLVALRQHGVAVGVVLLDRREFGAPASGSAALQELLQRHAVDVTLLGRRVIAPPPNPADRFIYTPLGRAVERPADRADAAVVG